MRTIAIVFGDNDFIQTFTPLMETLKDIIYWHSNKLTREEIIEIIKLGTYFHYVAYQDIPGNMRKDIKYENNIKKYLNECKILFDDEAEKVIETDDNGSTFYLLIESGQTGTV